MQEVYLWIACLCLVMGVIGGLIAVISMEDAHWKFKAVFSLPATAAGGFLGYIVGTAISFFVSIAWWCLHHFPH